MPSISPKADIRHREWHVRLVPKADINEPCPRILFFARATTGIWKPWRLCQKQSVNSAFCFENRFLLIVALNLAAPKDRQFRTSWMNSDQP